MFCPLLSTKRKLQGKDSKDSFGEEEALAASAVTVSSVEGAACHQVPFFDIQ